MIPNGSLSTEAYPASFLGIRSVPPKTRLDDHESANISINEFVYEYQEWTGRLIGNDVVISSPGQPDEVAVTDTGITEFSFTFDQNKRVIVSYVTGGVAKLRWYDQNVSGMVTTVYDNTYISPRVSLDDKHRLGGSSNDVIFAYIRNNNLYYRQQRDRYQVEYLLGAMPAGSRLRRIGMNTSNRFQFEYFVPYGNMKE